MAIEFLFLFLPLSLSLTLCPFSDDAPLLTRFLSSLGHSLPLFGGGGKNCEKEIEIFSFPSPLSLLLYVYSINWLLWIFSGVY